MTGWLKLHRQLQDNPLWNCEPFSRGQAWVDLMMTANHAPSYFYLRGNRIDVGRGVVARSKSKLAEDWKWSRGKVLRFLSDIEKDGQIVQQTVHNFTLITLCNYDEYQRRDEGKSNANDTTDNTTDGQQTEQQTVHIQEEKQQQECKEEKETPPPVGDDGLVVEEIVITLPAKGGTIHEIGSRQFERYRENYPTLDVMAQLKAIRQHLEDNPHKRMPEWNCKTFISSWLNNRLGYQGKKSQKLNTHGDFNSDRYAIDETARRFKIAGESA